MLILGSSSSKGVIASSNSIRSSEVNHAFPCSSEIQDAITSIYNGSSPLTKVSPVLHSPVGAGPLPSGPGGIPSTCHNHSFLRSVPARPFPLPSSPSYWFIRRLASGDKTLAVLACITFLTYTSTAMRPCAYSAMAQ